MFSKVKPFLLHAISSVHAGSGSEIGLVDLPIQREKHTGYPKVESSSLKGAIRSTVHEKLEQDGTAEELSQFITVFGSEPGERDRGESVAGAIAFADARVLLFPIKSMRGIFAWVTCPYVLERFNQENLSYQTGLPELPVPGARTVSSDRLLVGKNDRVVLEEYTFPVKVDQSVIQLAETLGKWLVSPTLSQRIKENLVVLSDEDFSDFVLLATEVNARIRIDQETGIVEDGALWYEENVPPETVFYSYLFAGKSRQEKSQLESAADILAFIENEAHFPEVFQLGGSSTLGRGMLRRIWLEG